MHLVGWLLLFVIQVPQVFSIFRVDDNIPRGQIGLSVFHREWANVSLNQTVKVKFLDLETSLGASVYIAKIILEVRACGLHFDSLNFGKSRL